MRPIFINGLGCFESGARTVLRELMATFPREKKALLVLPSCNRGDVAALPANIRVVALNHTLFGRWLRPLYEFIVWLTGKAGCFSRIINLSHYGWCPGGEYTLYFHNLLFLENTHDRWDGQGGRPNHYKRRLFHSCLRNADTIVVQTPEVKARLQSYASAQKLQPRAIIVAALRISAPEKITAAQRRFEVQFFYPTSVFPHKRVELAVRAIQLAHTRDPRIGLIVTAQPISNLQATHCVQWLGALSHEQVWAHYATADALLFTSAHETLGLPLLEALTQNLPAVLPALPYAQTLYGDAGTYFEGDDVEAVAAAILRLTAARERWQKEVCAQAPSVLRNRLSWAEHWPLLLSPSQADHDS